MSSQSYNAIDTLADLYTFTTGHGSYILLMGNSAIGDIGTTCWRYDATSTATDNFSAGIVKPTSVSGSGRWVREDNFPFLLSDHAPSRTLNSAFQVSAILDAHVFYTLSVACSLSLTGGTDGEIQLQTSPDNVTFTTKAKMGGSNTGSLTIGLNTTQKSVGQVSCKVPKGYYVKLVTVNNTGTATFALIQSVENY